MSLEAVASRQIQASQEQLLKPKVLTHYLLDDTFLLLNKQSIEPLHESNMSISAASATVELEILTDLSMSNTFCKITRERLETEIRKIIGHSPDIVDDILNPIIKAIEDLIEFVIAPLASVVNTVKTEVRGGFSYIGNRLGGIRDSITGFVDTTIKASQKVITDAVDYVEGQVTAILEGVIDLANTLFLTLEKVFDKIGNIFKDLLTMEPSDIVNLQMELTKLAGEAMMKGAKG